MSHLSYSLPYEAGSELNWKTFNKVGVLTKIYNFSSPELQPYLVFLAFYLILPIWPSPIRGWWFRRRKVVYFIKNPPLFNLNYCIWTHRYSVCLLVQAYWTRSHLFSDYRPEHLVLFFANVWYGSLWQLGMGITSSLLSDMVIPVALWHILTDDLRW